MNDDHSPIVDEHCKCGAIMRANGECIRKSCSEGKKTYSIDVTPEGLKTEEGKKRVAEALEARNTADYECYKTLKELWSMVGNTKKFRDFLLEYSADEHWTDKIIEEAEKAIRNREDTNNEFLNAVAGR
jgi:hypothetical protein